MQDISLTFGVTPLLAGAGLAVAAGDRICLVGRNGSGKSTLLRIAAGLVQPDAGDRFAQPGATVHYLPQEPDLSGFATALAYVEAGFGADLGAEKFFDIKCRKAGLKPDAAVVVATVRALKMHAGVALDQLRQENVAAVEAGFANLRRHLANIRQFGVPAVVSVNRFSADTPREHACLQKLCAAEGVKVVIADHWAQGGEGAVELARAVVELAESGSVDFRFLYPDEMPLWDKVCTIAQRIYGADMDRLWGPFLPVPEVIVVLICTVLVIRSYSDLTVFNLDGSVVVSTW